MDVNEIEVTIEEDGSVTVNVTGVQGQSCLDITAQLEQELGGLVESREMKPEALESAVEQNKDWQKQGF